MPAPSASSCCSGRSNSRAVTASAVHPALRNPTLPLTKPDSTPYSPYLYFLLGGCWVRVLQSRSVRVTAHLTGTVACPFRCEVRPVVPKVDQALARELETLFDLECMDRASTYALPDEEIRVAEVNPNPYPDPDPNPNPISLPDEEIRVEVYTYPRGGGEPCTHDTRLASPRNPCACRFTHTHTSLYSV